MSKPSLGVTFFRAYPPETLADYARRAEAAGFDELWLWEDSFYAGAFTSAATALAATGRIKVGIGILPATVRNPVFAAMEIMTLARLYPGRFLPGFGHGVDVWMKQIGAYPKSTLKAVEETVNAVRSLLRGENVMLLGDHVHLDNVRLELVPKEVPPIFIGGIREKSLRLAGRSGDGTILTEMASPAYVRWAGEQITAGMLEGGRAENQRVVSVFCKVNPDSQIAREPVRRALAERFAWARPHLLPLGIADEAREMIQEHGVEGAAKRMPDAWVDELSAAGRPDQVSAALERFAEAGAGSIVLLPVEGDPSGLDEYIRYLMPVLRG
jgi:alkanesulfonate monooxygenase SsuD/methylene tetrahydromethanopterin reductase-like flavin-dependent oxidoreductase (luciferase family)